MEKLQPCPFCGGEWHKPEMRSYYNSYSGRNYFVLCPDCGATSRHEPTEEYAAQMWNKRHH